MEVTNLVVPGRSDERGRKEGKEGGGQLDRLSVLSSSSIRSKLTRYLRKASNRRSAYIHVKERGKRKYTYCIPSHSGGLVEVRSLPS